MQKDEIIKAAEQYAKDSLLSQFRDDEDLVWLVTKGYLTGFEDAARLVADEIDVSAILD